MKGTGHAGSAGESHPWVTWTNDMKCHFGWVIVLSLVGAAGCASTGSPKSATDPTPASAAVAPGTGLLGGWEPCAPDGHPSGAAPCVREAAKLWLYAQLANNAYADDRVLELPDYVEPQRLVEGRGGFKARVYRVNMPSQDPEVVIAYAGTEDLSDWLYGNLNPFYSQGKQGRELLETVRAADPTAKIVLTGHSLGGGIAKYVVTREPGLLAYVFNPSVFVLSGPLGSKQNIYAVSQYGEILAFLRKLVMTGMDGHTTLGCTKASPIGRHGVRVIAECLTHIAAWDDERAACSLELNGLSPPKTIEDNELVAATGQPANPPCSMETVAGQGN